jgi:hypothetical protein
MHGHYPQLLQDAAKGAVFAETRWRRAVHVVTTFTYRLHPRVAVWIGYTKRNRGARQAHALEAIEQLMHHRFRPSERGRSDDLNHARCWQSCPSVPLSGWP